jgi:ubiquinol-cytochrome c reductase iron-sulfur subunit
VGGAFVAVPFVSSFQPSERAKAAGAAVEVDISALQPGEKVTVEWRGKPVWIMKRTPEQLAALPKFDGQLADPKSDRTAYPTPDYAKNTHRSIKPEIFVGVGICSHLGCSPSDKFQAGPQPSLPDDWQGGFLCPCHGSTFDLAGRVFKNKPAPDNLEVPPHMYVSDTKLVIGEDKKA